MIHMFDGMKDFKCTVMLDLNDSNDDENSNVCDHKTKRTVCSNG